MNGVIWPASIRTIIVSAALGAVLVLSAAAKSPLTTGGVVWFTALGAVAAVRPDSHAGLPFLVAYGWYWFVNVEGSLTLRALLAALCLATYHTAIAAASLAPLRWPGHRVIATRWIARLAIVSAGTAIVWKLAETLDSSPRAGRVVPFGAALVVLVGLAWLLTSASTRGVDSPTDDGE